jgi:hypothetical protein
MFEKAVQREGYTDTDIGKWGRFHADAGSNQMVYENGAYCWEVGSLGGPAATPPAWRLAAVAQGGGAPASLPLLLRR